MSGIQNSEPIWLLFITCFILTTFYSNNNCPYSHSPQTERNFTHIAKSYVENYS